MCEYCGNKIEHDEDYKYPTFDDLGKRVQVFYFDEGDIIEGRISGYDRNGDLVIGIKDNDYPGMGWKNTFGITVRHPEDSYIWACEGDCIIKVLE